MSDIISIQWNSDLKAKVILVPLSLIMFEKLIALISVLCHGGDSIAAGGGVWQLYALQWFMLWEVWWSNPGRF